jgi:FkbM family methyltransferase
MTTKYEPSSIQNFCKFVSFKFKDPDDVSTIFDVGSLHCLESIELSKVYKNARIFAFEANPDSYQVCLDNTKDYDNITVVNKAVHDHDGTCIFNAIDVDKTETPWFDGNRGASSLFKSNGAYNHIEKYIQKEIEVPCIQLETFCKENSINNVDVMWMDLQGAELIALESMGKELLSTVQVIHTELETTPIYKDQCLFQDVNQFLKNNSMYRAEGNYAAQFGQNFIFVRK